ncbi:prolyl-tRNA ligase [Candidatus Mycoplasma haematolamae str. Purdue]|uniref:Proline--tRNA ligase n=1 Tax=Mycoplasma haematolamae (strain Purdue) TaxID=1212765 RepID=I7CED4_MYCHA|nr:aminoacyl--tRNA ligase-related protein [Candidatus Mycoplasma haematolamae]AFO51591.1 prolyl-tRNA ligase [Candidatus Mycoplasma haematolamae str. Purdue]
MSVEKKYETLLLEGQLASSGLVSGTFFLHPRGYFVWSQIQRYLDREFGRLGVQNVLFPALIPLSTFVEEKELNESLDLDEIMKIHSDKTEPTSVATLRPTSEILFSHFFKERLQERSVHLPYLLNQWSSVYRSEKNTKLFFRSKEFYWQELHSVHNHQEEAEAYLAKIHEIYQSLLMNVLCIQPISGEKTFLERFPGAEKTLSNECILPDGQTLQLTTSHYLGDFFSKFLNIRYFKSNEESINPVQLSAGCSTRLLGALVEMHKDPIGIVLPWDLSPQQIAILTTGENEEEELNKFLDELTKNLENYRLYIDATDTSFGKKISKVETLGIPMTIIVGKKEIVSQILTCKPRISEEKKQIPIEKIAEGMEGFKAFYNSTLLDRSRDFLANLIQESRNWEELTQLISEGKVVLAPWFDDQENERNLKSLKHTFSIRCIKERIQEESNLVCIFSNQPANCLAYFGRSY